MRMRVVAHGIELSNDMKAFIRRRMQFNLGRFQERIKSLTVRLADMNGPRGGIDKCCDIRVDAGFRQPVIVSERQATAHAAVALAMDRVERAVKRQLHLERPASNRATISMSLTL